MAKRALLVLLVAAVLPLAAVDPAWAQAREGPVGGGLFDAAMSVFREIQRWLDRTGAPRAFQTLGEHMLVVLVLIQFYSGWVHASTPGMVEALIRLAIGSLLLNLSANGTVDWLLEQGYRVSRDVGFQILVQVPGEFERGLNRMFAGTGERLTALLGVGIGVAFVIVAGMVFSGLFTLIIGLMATFGAMYLVVQIMVLVVLAIAAVVAPLSFAAFGYSGTARWTWKWASGVLHALVTLLFANIVVAVTVWLVTAMPMFL